MRAATDRRPICAVLLAAAPRRGASTKGRDHPVLAGGCAAGAARMGHVARGERDAICRIGLAPHGRDGLHEQPSWSARAPVGAHCAAVAECAPRAAGLAPARPRACDAYIRGLSAVEADCAWRGRGDGGRACVRPMGGGAGVCHPYLPSSTFSDFADRHRPSPTCSNPCALACGPVPCFSRSGSALPAATATI